MDSETLQQFIRESESRLSAIRGNILVCLQDGNSRGEIDNSFRQARMIKDSASELGLNDIRRVAAEVEKEFETAIAADSRFSEAQSRGLLDKLAVLEAHLTKITFRVEFFPADIADFIEESFENLQIKPLKKADAETVEIAEENEEEFEVDEEMLEVFMTEAEELLQNINSRLKILEQNANNREALLEIRRSAHTLKGSAGIVGLKKLSDLAHRVEDLLDFLAENEIAASEKIFELLLTATDCFETLAHGEISQQTEKKIRRLYENFDEALASLQKKKQTDESNSNYQVSSREFGISGFELKTDDRFANPQSEIPNPKSVVRVSLEKLDELIKLVSDLVVSRSAFERYLSEMERQSNELRNSTNRLQRSTDKLETDFEVNLLGAATAGIKQGRGKSGRREGESIIFTPGVFNSSGLSFSLSQFDALEFDRYTEFHQTTRQLIEAAADSYAINAELDALKGNLEILFDNQRRLIEEMQEKLLRLRMVKFDMLSARLQRTVRVTCDEEEKLADLLIEGENQEFDTQILDSLVEPLLHLLRNAVAHGIEPPETRRLLGKDERGKILLRVQNEGTHINLTITDDGRGISAAALIEKAVQNNFISTAEGEKMSEQEAFSLMFLPGLTTADKLSQVAGRGVGMNVVKTNILRQQGTISVSSEAQKGATLTVRLPLSLALTRALIVKTGGQTFAFPSKLVRRVSEIPIKNTLSKSARIDGENYSVLHITEILGLPPTPESGGEQTPVLLLEILKNSFALTVDEIVGIEEIVIKPLGAPLENSPEFLGAAILGDGRIAPVLDLVYLLKHKAQTPNAKIQNQAKTQNSGLDNQPEIQNPKSKMLSVLIVDDSPTVRQISSSMVKGAGWQPITARDGLEALEILQAFRELPDAILTDVEMPRMSGYELLSALKREENLRDIPVVMITSRCGEKHRQKAFELGVSEYLTKPYEDTKLIETIRRLTEFKK